jgi:hypothetical protein
MTYTPMPGPSPTPVQYINGLYAVRVRGDGTRIDIEGGLLVSAVVGEALDVSDVQVIYNRVSQEYLVFWREGGQLFSRRVSRLGEPLADRVALTPAGTTATRPHLAHNSRDGGYLVVWSEVRMRQLRADVVGLCLTAEGQLQGSAFALQGSSLHEFPTDLVYNAEQDEYLLAWDSDQGTLYKRSLHRLAPDGALLGDPIITDGGVFSLGVDNAGNYLVLTQFGHRAQPLSFAPCTATPTPGTTESPTPPGFVSRVVQWERPIRAIEEPRYGAQRLIFTVRDNLGMGLEVNSLTHVDEQFGLLEVGATVWVTSYQVEEWMEVAESVVVLPPERAATTPTPAQPALAGWHRRLWPSVCSQHPGR